MEQTEKLLKKKIKEKKAQLISIAKDAKFAETLIDELLSLKAQLGIEPTELHLPCSSVYDELKTDTYTVKLLKEGALVSFKSGVSTFVTPYNKSLHTMLVELFSERKHLMAIDEDKRTDEEKEQFDIVDTTFQALMQCFLSPIMGAVNPKILFHVASEQIKVFRETTEEMLNEELHNETAEDAQKNAEFAQQQELLETMANAIKE